MTDRISAAAMDAPQSRLPVQGGLLQGESLLPFALPLEEELPLQGGTESLDGEDNELAAAPDGPVFPAAGTADIGFMLLPEAMLAPNGAELPVEMSEVPTGPTDGRTIQLAAGMPARMIAGPDVAGSVSPVVADADPLQRAEAGHIALFDAEAVAGRENPSVVRDMRLTALLRQATAGQVSPPSADAQTGGEGSSDGASGGESGRHAAADSALMNRLTGADGPVGGRELPSFRIEPMPVATQADNGSTVLQSRGNAAAVSPPVSLHLDVESGFSPPDVVVRVVDGARLDITISTSDVLSQQRLDGARGQLVHALHQLGSEVEAVRVELRPDSGSENGTGASSGPGGGHRGSNQTQGQAHGQTQAGFAEGQHRQDEQHDDQQEPWNRTGAGHSLRLSAALDGDDVDPLHLARSGILRRIDLYA